MNKLALAVCTLLLSTYVHAQELTGMATVVDGDTIKVNGQSVRLAAIDAPECSQAYGPDAYRYVVQLIEGKTVRVQYTTTDKYNRVIGQVYIDGLWVNREIVKQGFATWYKRYAPDLTEFGTLEDNAKRNRTGVMYKLSTMPEQYRHTTTHTYTSCK